MLIGAAWGLVGAVVVWWILKWNETEAIAAVERGENVDFRRGVSPATGFFVCWLTLLAAPFVLGKARGARGVLEGVGVLVGAWAMAVATAFALALAR